MKKTNNIKYVVGIMILIIVSTVVYVKRKSVNPIQNGELVRLPSFVSTDINGTKIKSTDFKGKHLYVQFIRPVDENNIGLFNKIYTNWKEKELKFLIISKRYDQIKSNMNFDSEKEVIFISDYDKLKSLFNAPEYGSHYLFNRSGDKLFQEKNYKEYEAGIKRHLIQSIDKDNFSISDFIKVNENINNMEGFDQLSDIVHKEKYEYYIISMFSSVCDSCAQGTIIEWQKLIHLKSKKSTYVLGILSNKYDEDDITILKSQLRIPFQVVIANGSLSQQWNKLVEHYSESVINGIVFFMDNSGHILEVLDPNCKTCWNPFFDRLETLTLK